MTRKKTFALVGAAAIACLLWSSLASAAYTPSKKDYLGTWEVYGYWFDGIDLYYEIDTATLFKNGGAFYTEEFLGGEVFDAAWEFNGQLFALMIFDDYDTVLMGTMNEKGFMAGSLAVIFDDGEPVGSWTADKISPAAGPGPGAEDLEDIFEEFTYELEPDLYVKSFQPSPHSFVGTWYVDVYWGGGEGIEEDDEWVLEKHGVGYDDEYEDFIWTSSGALVAIIGLRSGILYQGVLDEPKFMWGTMTYPPDFVVAYDGDPGYYGLWLASTIEYPDEF